MQWNTIEFLRRIKTLLIMMYVVIHTNNLKCFIILENNKFELS